MSKESSHFKSLINRAITIALYFFQQKLLYNYYFHNYFLDFCSFFISWNQYLVSCMLYPVSSRDGHRFCERIFFFENKQNLFMNVGVFQKKNHG